MQRYIIAMDNTPHRSGPGAQASHSEPDEIQPLNIERCQQARLARDRRFDGEFFIAVKTTGIYCRPICPARLPAEKNVTYIRFASQAAEAGYRPCLRCRPESAPASSAWRGTSTTVLRAVRLIHEGALNHCSVADFSAQLGIGERYLRKLFQQQLGVSPQAVALNQRLLFAKKLLAETDLPITEVAFAAGFGSVRRFNSSLLAQFKLTPSQLRNRRKDRACTSDDSPITLQLHYRPPYDWLGVMQFFSRHAIPGIEEVSESRYVRHFKVGKSNAWFSVHHKPDRNALELTVSLPDHSQLIAVVNTVRRMFDLDANPSVISARFANTQGMETLLQRSPGSRSPGHWSLFEAAIRAIIGQQISTVAARNICARIARAASDQDFLVFPSAREIAQLNDSHFPMPGRRRETLHKLCTQFAGRDHELDLTSLAQFKGVGPWTVAMVAMRGAGETDVFPPKDLVLEKSWAAVNSTETLHKGELTQLSESWRPWRSYAANLLWRSFSQ